VLGREEGMLSVSGRSLGGVNVQVICEKLGGGGHLPVAGAQLGDIDMDEGRTLVYAAIKEYIQEGGET